ncbi:solute carrier family 28 member 3-like [Babylonia areolata]|uniref:solute carrier family 28 member 3-like n=1 Tax=Babylonia areolata TaxID=304850 RepID=UPI003FD67E85
MSSVKQEGYDECVERVAMVELLPSETSPELEHRDHPDIDRLSEEDEEDSSETEDNSPKGCRCRNETVCLPCLAVRECTTICWKRSGAGIKTVVAYLVTLLFLVYVGLALARYGGQSDQEETATLLAITAVLVVAVLWKGCRRVSCLRSGLQNCMACCARPFQRCYGRHSGVIDTCVVVLIVIGIVIYVVVDVAMKRPASLVSAVGIAVFIIVMFLASHAPRKVAWRPVGGGLLLQFVFALLVLRTSWGRAAFSWMADRMTTYMAFTDQGAQFVFGNDFREHFFVFRVMPTIIFFSATISILYYFGVLQVLIKGIAKVMNATMATGGLETFHAAVNIFCGWAESLMVIRPFMDTMTKAELHAVMTNGFSTVAGSAIGAYVLYGVSAKHLISASCMSAPAALAMSKLFYPSKRRHLNKIDTKQIPSQGTGLVDAASLGAVAAVGVVAHIVATVIAFISLLSFLNASLQWFGQRVGLAPPLYPPLTFQFICSYILWPVAFLLGVPAQDCRVVARLLGVKIFINEFIAYEDLGHVRANRLALDSHVASNGTWRLVGSEETIELVGTNSTLEGGVISPRSEMLATYALCGFSDLVALGMMSTALSTVAPSRRRHILQVAPRALVSGIMACLLTAAMAGLVAEDG